MPFLHAAGFVGLLGGPVRSFAEEADDVVGHLEWRLPVLGWEQTGECGEDDCWCRGFRFREHARKYSTGDIYLRFMREQLERRKFGKALLGTALAASAAQAQQKARAKRPWPPGIKISIQMP